MAKLLGNIKMCIKISYEAERGLTAMGLGVSIKKPRCKMCIKLKEIMGLGFMGEGTRTK